jgi:hypothetical protein
MDLSGEYMRPEPTAADAARLEAAAPDALHRASDGVPGVKNTWQGSVDLHSASYAHGDGAGDRATAMARNTLMTPAEPATAYNSLQQWLWRERLLRWL